MNLSSRPNMVVTTIKEPITGANIPFTQQETNNTPQWDQSRWMLMDTTEVLPGNTLGSLTQWILNKMVVTVELDISFQTKKVFLQAIQDIWWTKVWVSHLPLWGAVTMITSYLGMTRERGIGELQMKLREGLSAGVVSHMVQRVVWISIRNSKDIMIEATQ